MTEELYNPSLLAEGLGAAAIAASVVLSPLLRPRGFIQLRTCGKSTRPQHRYCRPDYP